MMKDDALVNQIINLALEEDLGENGDITSNSILSNELINFTVVSREDFLLSGIEIVRIILTKHSKDVDYRLCKNDGDFVCKGQNIITGCATAKTLMPLERTILNFLQHCSGVSSYTRQFVKAICSTKAIVRSTRKTTPGLRIIEKYAVEVGGGQNYRINLSDGILIKDNHIASCGGIKEAITKIRSSFLFSGANQTIAVECDNIEQVKIAFAMDVDLILLDNMSLENLKKSVEICQGKVKLEATGGINLSNVLSIAETGVDYVSIGVITHSFPGVDIALDIVDFL